MTRFVSLWNGPQVYDRVESTPPGAGIAYSFTWHSVGLYGLDGEGRAWTYCFAVCRPDQGKWILFDDLMSGAAARRLLAEEASA